ncbi:MAG: ComF family protein [Candidatus Omnitrophota bacterium]|nr:ComF family protein [Candidatus Omnitrophota bacterium]
MFSVPSAFKGFINLIYPLHCQICKVKLDPANTRYLCENCWNKVKKYCRNSSVCDEYFFNKIWSVGKYEGILKECIHLLKYSKKSFIARPLGELMNSFIANYPELKTIDFITPAPLYSAKLRERGFNQSAELAIRISERFNIPVSLNNLYRTRYTLSQTGLSRHERLLNVRAAFSVKNNPFLKKRVLLIDDVFTTGATVNECSKTLLKAGAQTVRILTLARGN